MKALGIVRNLDSLGRVVVPAHIRKELDWDFSTPLEIFADGRGIFLQKYEKACVFCGTETNVEMFEKKPICKTCLARLRK